MRECRDTNHPHAMAARCHVASVSLSLAALLATGCAVIPLGSDGQSEGKLPFAGTSGSTGSAQEGSSQAFDQLVEYAVYQVGEDEGCREYQVFYYGVDTRRLVAFADETIFDADVGYTSDLLEDLSFSQVWKGVDELSFSHCFVEDRGDYLLAVMRLGDLDDPANVKALQESGLLPLEGGSGKDGIDATALIQLTVDRGGRFVSIDEEDFGKLRF